MAHYSSTPAQPTMKACLVNYNFDPVWLKDFPELEVTIYDRSDDGVERNLIQYGVVYKTENVGNIDYDKLSYLVDNYDDLPDVFLWAKSNLLKYVYEDYLREKLKEGKFAPLLKMDHRTYSDSHGVVCYYHGDMYYERADSWFFNSPDLAKKYFFNWHEWASYFQVPMNRYIPFPPGGNFILTRERVYKYGRDYYQEMRDVLPYAQLPVEACAAERSYYSLWK